MRLYRIISQSPNLDLRLTPGAAAPNPTGGYGGWVEVSRPAAIPFTVWEGGTSRKQDISVMLDGYASGTSVEGDLELVKRLGRPPKKDDETPPPVFRVFGPIHESGSYYVLEALEFGTVIRASDGTVLRQEMILKLMEYADPDEIRLRKRTKTTKPKQGRDYNAVSSGSGGVGPGPSVYEAKAGDTLKKIAAKFYGKVGLWRELGELNGIRDPDKKLTPGQKIKLPEWI